MNTSYLEDLVLVRERLKEVVDFATSESPYRNANKGWINDDVYLQWGGLSNRPDNGNDELLDVAIFWEPIKKLVLILFLVIAIASILVFGAISFSKGRFDFSLISSSFGDEAIEFQSANKTQTLQSEELEEDLSQEIVEEKVQLVQVQESGEDLIEHISREPLNQQEEVNNLSQPQSKKNLGSAGNLF